MPGTLGGKRTASNSLESGLVTDSCELLCGFGNQTMVFSMKSEDS